MQQQEPLNLKKQKRTGDLIGAFATLIASSIWNLYWWFILTFTWAPGRNAILDWGITCLITLVPISVLAILLIGRGRQALGICLLIPAVVIALYYGIAHVIRH